MLYWKFASVQKVAGTDANVQVVYRDMLIIKLKNMTGWALPDKPALESKREPIVY
jgi:hypothetical protein